MKFIIGDITKKLQVDVEIETLEELLRFHNECKKFYGNGFKGIGIENSYNSNNIPKLPKYTIWVYGKE